MTNRYTSDLHFGHKNIIQLEKRPFENLADMHSQLISNWNSVVEPDDDTWIVGDFIGGQKIHSEEVRKIVSQLNGRKHLVLGNHDSDSFKVWTWQDLGFASVHTVCKVEEYNDEVWLAHHPDARERYGLPDYVTLFHGHTHSEGGMVSMSECGGCTINVGVDIWNFIPVTFEQIRSKLMERIISRGCKKRFNIAEAQH